MHPGPASGRAQCSNPQVVFHYDAQAKKIVPKYLLLVALLLKLSIIQPNIAARADGARELWT